MGQSKRDLSFPLGTVAVDGGTIELTGDLAITDPLPAGTNNIGDVDIASALPAGTNTIGNVNVVAPSSVVFGRKTIAAAGTEEQLAASTAVTQGVTVRALTANTNLVFVGGANTVSSATGYQLAAGESVFIACDNLADVWLDVTTNGEGVSYIGG